MDREIGRPEGGFYAAHHDNGICYGTDQKCTKMKQSAMRGPIVSGSPMAGRLPGHVSTGNSVTDTNPRCYYRNGLPWRLDSQVALSNSENDRKEPGKCSCNRPALVARTQRSDPISS